MGRFIPPVVCEIHADLIVLSTRLRDRLGGTWLGGVVDAVVACANQPLLLVRERVRLAADPTSRPKV